MSSQVQWSLAFWAPFLGRDCTGCCTRCTSHTLRHRCSSSSLRLRHCTNENQSFLPLSTLSLGCQCNDLQKVIKFSKSPFKGLICDGGEIDEVSAGKMKTFKLCWNPTCFSFTFFCLPFVINKGGVKVVNWPCDIVSSSNQTRRRPVLIGLLFVLIQYYDHFWEGDLRQASVEQRFLKTKTTSKYVFSNLIRVAWLPRVLEYYERCVNTWDTSTVTILEYLGYLITYLGRHLTWGTRKAGQRRIVISSSRGVEENSPSVKISEQSFLRPSSS